MKLEKTYKELTFVHLKSYNLFSECGVQERLLTMKELIIYWRQSTWTWIHTFLEAAPHKAEAVQPLSTHHENSQN